MKYYYYNTIKFEEVNGKNIRALQAGKVNRAQSLNRINLAIELLLHQFIQFKSYTLLTFCT